MKNKIIMMLLSVMLVGCTSDFASNATYEGAVVAATTGLVGVVYGSNITLCYEYEIDLNDYEYLDSTYLYDDDGNIYVDYNGDPIVFPLYEFKGVNEYE